jgi:hypothetical protein
VASYYYLVSTLPSLRWEDESPFSCDEFLVMCKGNISEKDYNIIEETFSGKPTSSKYVKGWQAFQTMVKKEMADQRSKKLNIAGEKYKNSGDKESRIVESVRNALSAPNALDGELIIMQLYWKYLDDESASHVFDLEGLLGFSIKLQLLERKSSFDRVEGNREFVSLLSNLQSNIKGN